MGWERCWSDDSDEDIVAYRVVTEAPVEETGPWRPKEGETYFCVYLWSDAIIECAWANDDIDRCRAAFGNIFRTRREAEAKRAEILGGK